jgi:nitrite reductase/ring-hydroxylating ferredoxin subunit
MSAESLPADSLPADSLPAHSLPAASLPAAPRPAGAPDSLQPRFPFPHAPRGWFCLGLSADLAPGQLVSRAFVGEEVVLWRGEDGVAALTTAWCPHIGAHLGRGGAVVGGRLRCPFHHFEFDAAGACVHTPYGHEPPRAARARTWPVAERNGLIFAWHGPAGEPPGFELPTLPTEGFTGPETWTWTLRTHPQEISENSVDIGHFSVVHRYSDVAERAPLVVDGAVLRIAYGFRRAVEIGGMKLGHIRTDFTGEVHGLGYSSVNSVVNEVGIRSLHLVLPTPVQPGFTELRICLWTRVEDRLKGPAAPLMALPASLRDPLISWFAFQGYRHDVAQDIEIWENKAYLHPPALARGDGPLGRYRSWCRQFYEGMGAAG